MKGFIALNGGRISKTHDLLMLNKVCLTFCERFIEIENECIELTDYGVQMRYPFHIEIEEQDMIKAVKSVEKIIELVKREKKE